MLCVLLYGTRLDFKFKLASRMFIEAVSEVDRHSLEAHGKRDTFRRADRPTVIAHEADGSQP